MSASVHRDDWAGVLCDRLFVRRQARYPIIESTSNRLCAARFDAAQGGRWCRRVQLLAEAVRVQPAHPDTEHDCSDKK